MLQTTKENFDKLESRLLSINSNIDNVSNMREMLYSLSIEQKPTLIMATGGSKVVAYYLKLVLERIGFDGITCEVIEPRDYFYKHDRGKFSNLVVISASGNTNGVKEALDNFKGQKFLVCENTQEGNYEVISWGNDSYDKEHSFISLASSLGPITMMLDITGLGALNLGVIAKDLENTNKKIVELLHKSQEKIANLSCSFKDTNIIQIISGYDTMCSSSALESNLTEAGLCVPILHDKGSFCHGRSNILNSETPIIYLSHKPTDLDKILIDAISKEYPNLYHFNTTDLKDESYFFREYYLLLQMYFISKKIADDKEKDLTKPDYNRKLIKSLYEYRGRL